MSVGSPRRLVVPLTCKLTSSLWSTNVTFFRAHLVYVVTKIETTALPFLCLPSARTKREHSPLTEGENTGLWREALFPGFESSGPWALARQRRTGDGEGARRARFSSRFIRTRRVREVFSLFCGDAEFGYW